MNIDKYIVKARPGVVGGKFEEKRPLRERIELPVKRHIFINRDSHPDADIYVAIHEYKVTRGAGTVTVLFRNRGYTHEDKQPDLEKGNREAAKFASYIIKPDVRPTTEIKYHTDAAPGVRYVFVDGKLKPEAGFYTVVRSVANVKPTQANYVDMH